MFWSQRIKVMAARWLIIRMLGRSEVLLAYILLHNCQTIPIVFRYLKKISNLLSILRSFYLILRFLTGLVKLDDVGVVGGRRAAREPGNGWALLGIVLLAHIVEIIKYVSYGFLIFWHVTFLRFILQFIEQVRFHLRQRFFIQIFRAQIYLIQIAIFHQILIYLIVLPDNLINFIISRCRTFPIIIMRFISLLKPIIITFKVLILVIHSIISHMPAPTLKLCHISSNYLLYLPRQYMLLPLARLPYAFPELWVLTVQLAVALHVATSALMVGVRVNWAEEGGSIWGPLVIRVEVLDDAHDLEELLVLSLDSIEVDYLGSRICIHQCLLFPASHLCFSLIFSALFCAAVPLIPISLGSSSLRSPRLPKIFLKHFGKIENSKLRLLL